MGLDARVRYTRMVIKESFIDLVEEKPFHNITLKEVCERAEINRSTFYKHYKDTYDWKEQTEDSFLEDVNALFVQCDTDDVTGILERQFEEMKKNERLYRMVASPNFESTVMEEMVSLIIQRTDEETRRSRKISQDTDYTRRWDCYYLIKGCLGAMECWVHDGMREEPAALAKYMAQKIYASGGRPRTEDEAG